jgi:hypothetical protein
MGASQSSLVQQVGVAMGYPYLVMGLTLTLLTVKSGTSR